MVYVEDKHSEIHKSSLASCNIFGYPKATYLQFATNLYLFKVYKATMDYWLNFLPGLIDYYHCQASI